MFIQLQSHNGRHEADTGQRTFGYSFAEDIVDVQDEFATIYNVLFLLTYLINTST